MTTLRRYCARGVVLACCLRSAARLYGVRSAMPMFKAPAACPDAVVIRPDMAKYREVGRAVCAAMLRLTPLVEPLSIDEAFLDLPRTQELHGACPAQVLAALALRVEAELGITVSIGLSDNQSLRGRHARRGPYRRPAEPVRPRIRPTPQTRTSDRSAPRETG